MNIDANLILKALNYYQNLGYKLISVSTVVDVCCSESTSPSGKVDLRHNDKVYVASAEQSFLQMIKEETLTEGLYCAITPCYRDELIPDSTHFKIFLKIELFSLDSICYLDLKEDAQVLFEDLGVETISEVIDKNQMDLISPFGVELGSYGKREYLGREYHYGTGLAEPRFSGELDKLLGENYGNN